MRAGAQRGADGTRKEGCGRRGQMPPQEGAAPRTLLLACAPSLGAEGSVFLEKPGILILF